MKPSQSPPRFRLPTMEQLRSARLGNSIHPTEESMDAAHRMVAQTFRQEADRILASLISVVRDFELAQDALADALLIALERWPVEGIPRNPVAWISTIARRKAINRLRRESTLARKQLILQELLKREEQRGAEEMETLSIPDERLKLMFTCCHPALALEAHVALTLHTLGGLSTAERASAFRLPSISRRSC